MRLRRVVLGLVVVCGLAWSLWPSSVPVESEPPVAANDRVRTLFGTSPSAERPIDERLDERLEEVLSVCRQCRDGSRTGDICGACEGTSEPEPEEPTTAELVVDVVNEDGRPEDRARVQVWGCPVLDRSGNVFTVAPGLECWVRAFRPEGVLRVPSEAIRVAVEAQGAYVQLELPRERVGGLGIQFRVRPEGVFISAVNPGTPAEAMGLAHGDIITEVDGVSAVGLDQHDFVRALTGPVGSEVEFIVRTRDEDGVHEERRTLRRAFLEG